jgi:hypothetical protein
MPPRAFAFLGALLLGPTLSAAVVSPAIAFSPQRVTASGLTPGGQVVWFGVAREISQRVATIVRRTEIAEADKDGAAVLELEKAVPFQSIWVAVDLATGLVTVAGPEGFPLRQPALPVDAVGRGGGGQPDWVEDVRGYVEVLVVRPGEGAWAATVGDGGENDDDGAYDGRLRASLAGMRGVGEKPAEPPQRFNLRDVVVVIDPNRMEVSVHKVAEAPQ